MTCPLARERDRSSHAVPRPPRPQDGKHVCETAGHTFDESKAGVRCINNICDDRQCCLAPVTCGNSGGANLPHVCANRAMALDPKKKDGHCADRTCTDETCCAAVCKAGARCLLAPPPEVKLTTSAKLKTVGKAASRDDILAGLVAQLGCWVGPLRSARPA